MGVGVRWALSKLTCRCARKVSQRYTVQEKSSTAPKILFSAGISHIASSDADIPMATWCRRPLRRALVPHRHQSPQSVPAVSQQYLSLPSTQALAPPAIPPPPRSRQCYTLSHSATLRSEPDSDRKSTSLAFFTSGPSPDPEFRPPPAPPPTLDFVLQNSVSPTVFPFSCAPGSFRGFRPPVWAPRSRRALRCLAF